METTVKDTHQDKFKIKVGEFEGPFDLLLHLIEEKKIDIYTVSISEITSEYLDYLHKMQTLDLDIASEFLVLAAVLIELKSKMLLPGAGDSESEAFLEAEEERQALLKRLVEYKAFKNMARRLVERSEYYSYVLTREQINKHILSLEFKEEKPVVVKNATMDRLCRAFEKAWQDFEVRVITREIDHLSPLFYSIKEKMQEIIEKLNKNHLRRMFSELFLEVSSKNEIIAVFLAILELVKQDCIQIVQNDLFDDIEVIGRKHFTETDLDVILGEADEYNTVLALETESQEESKDETVQESSAGVEQGTELAAQAAGTGAEPVGETNAG